MKRCLVYIGLSTTLLFNISNADQCDRIVTFSPSIAEIMNELGLGEKIVGNISDFGTYSEPNIVEIKKLNPTVIFFDENLRDKETLIYSKEDLPSHYVSLQSLNDVLDSYSNILTFCNIPQDQVDQNILKNVEEIKKYEDKSPTDKSLLALYNERNAPANAVGKGIHRDILQFIGVKNYLYLRDMERPLITEESYVQLSPDILFTFMEKNITDYPNKDMKVPTIDMVAGDKKLIQAVFDGYPIMITTPQTVLELTSLLSAMLQRIEK